MLDTISARGVSALLTAIYGGWDTLKEPVEQEGVTDYVCVTDDPALKSDRWRIVVEPRPDEHPCLAAKHPKFCPWEYTSETETVWIDASHRPMHPAFVADVLGFTYVSPIAQFRHPWRDDIEDEAKAAATQPKYDGLPLLEQVECYRRHDEHPSHWGLWETGVIARRHHDPRLIWFGLDWLDECTYWTFQDQISEPVVLRRLGMRPAEFPYPARENHWFAYEPSERH